MWVYPDLNGRPLRCQRNALTNWAIHPFSGLIYFIHYHGSCQLKNLCYNACIMDKKQFLKIYLLQILSMVFGSLIITFVFIFFHNQGASIMALALGELILYLAAVSVFSFKKTFFSKTDFIKAIVINFAIITLLILANKFYFLWPIAFLRGLFMIFFC